MRAAAIDRARLVIKIEHGVPLIKTINKERSGRPVSPGMVVVEALVYSYCGWLDDVLAVST